MSRHRSLYRDILSLCRDIAASTSVVSSVVALCHDMCRNISSSLPFVKFVTTNKINVMTKLSQLQFIFVAT